jgi:hypothetical protein
MSVAQAFRDFVKGQSLTASETGKPHSSRWPLGIALATIVAFAGVLWAVIAIAIAAVF